MKPSSFRARVQECPLVKSRKLRGHDPRHLGPDLTERNRIVRRSIPCMKFITPVPQAGSPRKCKSRIEEQLGEAVGISFVAHRAFARMEFGRSGRIERAHRRMAGSPGVGGWKGVRGWIGALSLAAGKVTAQARARSAMGVAQLLFELGWRPGGITSRDSTALAAAEPPRSRGRTPGPVHRRRERSDRGRAGRKSLGGSW